MATKLLEAETDGAKGTADAIDEGAGAVVAVLLGGGKVTLN